MGFGSEQRPSPDTSLRVHTYNSLIVMDLAQTDGAICPTHWQANQFPKAARTPLRHFRWSEYEQLPLVKQEARLDSLPRG